MLDITYLPPRARAQWIQMEEFYEMRQHYREEVDKLFADESRYYGVTIGRTPDERRHSADYRISKDRSAALFWWYGYFCGKYALYGQLADEIFEELEERGYTTRGSKIEFTYGPLVEEPQSEEPPETVTAQCRRCGMERRNVKYDEYLAGCHVGRKYDYDGDAYICPDCGVRVIWSHMPEGKFTRGGVWVQLKPETPW